MQQRQIELVQRLRQRAVDEAKAELMASLTKVDLAEQSAHAQELAIRAESDRACDPSGEDSLVEAFAAWLPGAQAGLERARQQLDQLLADSARCRAELVACRSALEAVTLLARQHREARRNQETRAGQLAADEAAQAHHSRMQPPPN